jgi:adenylate cyclase
MAKEIERKFLVKDNAWKRLTLLKKVEIKQGYISKSAQHQVRIRIMDKEASLTVKGPKKGLTRDEYEYAVPIKDGKQLLGMSVTPVLSKTRYYVRDDAQQMWEVDVYKGLNKGLLVTEIELADDKQIIKIPSWIGKEVTHDKQYASAQLASNKAPKQ